MYDVFNMENKFTIKPNEFFGIRIIGELTTLELLFQSDIGVDIMICRDPELVKIMEGTLSELDTSDMLFSVSGLQAVNAKLNISDKIELFFAIMNTNDSLATITMDLEMTDYFNIDNKPVDGSIIELIQP